MGLGDDIMFLGEAEHIHKKTCKKIKPVYGSGSSIFFKNVEFLSDVNDINTVTVNARDTKAFSDYHVDYYVKKKIQTPHGEKLIFNQYSPKPFRLRFTEKEIERSSQILKEYNLDDNFVIINPDYKTSFFNNNKNWGFKKYQKLVDLLSKDIQVVRVMPGGRYMEPALENAINIPCEGLRISAALYTNAKFGISYDGLLQHILAGFDIPCVVIQGGLISRKNMNYKNHITIEYNHSKTPCGSTYDCSHCKEANKNITVEMVYEQCKKLL